MCERGRLPSRLPVAGQFDQRAHELAAGAGVAPGLGLVAKRRAGDVEVRPGRVADELLEELGGRDRAAPAAVADVLDVGHFALDQLVVDLRDTSAIARAARPRGGPRPAPRRTRADRWSSRRPLRCPAPRRTRRSAWPDRRSWPTPRSTASDSTSASTSRPSASVLCTSIVRPLRAVQHVAQLHGRRAGHVLDQPGEADHVDRQLQLGDGLHRAEHGRGAGHVALHRQHAVGRLERQPAGIERHALADDGQRRRVLRAAAIAQHHQPRRPARSLGHGQQRAAAFRSPAASRPRLRLPGRFASATSAARVGERFGIDLVGRLVDQPPRQIDALAQDAAAARWPLRSPPDQSSVSNGWRFFSARYRSWPWQPTIAPAHAAFGPLGRPALVEKEGHAASAACRPVVGRRPPRRERPRRRRTCSLRPRPTTSACSARPTGTSKRRDLVAAAGEFLALDQSRESRRPAPRRPRRRRRPAARLRKRRRRRRRPRFRRRAIECD